MLSKRYNWTFFKNINVLSGPFYKIAYRELFTTYFDDYSKALQSHLFLQVVINAYVQWARDSQRCNEVTFCNNIFYRMFHSSMAIYLPQVPWVKTNIKCKKHFCECASLMPSDVGQIDLSWQSDISIEHAVFDTECFSMYRPPSKYHWYTISLTVSLMWSQAQYETGHCSMCLLHFFC